MQLAHRQSEYIFVSIYAKHILFLIYLKESILTILKTEFMDNKEPVYFQENLCF